MIIIHLRKIKKSAVFAIVMLAVTVCLYKDSNATMWAINLNMNGSKVVPAVTTNGYAQLTGTYNDVTNVLTFSVTFSLLSGVTTGAHFHAPATTSQNAGVMIIWTGFPLGVTSGNYSNTFTLLPSQETNLLQGMVYADIHSAFAFNGEIRTQMGMQLRVFEIHYLMEGFYDQSINKLVRDTVTVNLRSSNFPYTIVDNGKVFLDSTGRGLLFSLHAPSFTPYYVQVLHRNALETWNRIPVSFTNNLLSVNFTAAANSAYGNNLIQKGSRFCAYSGDVNQDGVIDATDIGTIDNDALNFLTGYVNTDVNGDSIVDGTDFAITDNNAANYVSVIRP